MVLFKYLLESKGLGSMIFSAQSEPKRIQRRKLDKSVLGLLQSIYNHVSEGQQKNYDNAIEELREEVRGCRKEFAMFQELFIQAIKAKLNPNCVEMDMELLKELQSIMKKEDLGIIKKELEVLLEKEVVLNQEEQMMERDFSFIFHMKKLPVSASEVATFGSGQCQKCSASRYAICLLCGTVVCNKCSPKHKKERHQGRWMALTFAKNELELEGKTKGKKFLYLNAFMMPYEMKKEEEKDEAFQLNEEQFSKAVKQFLNWH